VLLVGSRDAGGMKITEPQSWGSRQLQSAQSVAGFVARFLSEDDKIELAQV